MAQKQLTIELAAPAPVHATRTVHRSPAAEGAAGSSAAANLVSAPLSGYVEDPSGGYRPVLGFGPFSSVGAPITFGENIASMTASPSQNYLVEIDSTGMASLWLDINGELGQTPFPTDVSATSSVAPSPLGFSVAVVSESRGLVQVFSSLPNAAALNSYWSFSDLGGTPASVAVSDDGSALLYTIREGRRERLEILQKGGTPQFLGAGEFGPMAFAPFSKDAAVSDSPGNRVYLYHNTEGNYATVLLGSETAGISAPVGLGFSRDGAEVVVASAGSRSVQILRVDSSGSSSTPCQCAPATLTRLLGNAVFQITAFDGAGMWVFDGDLQPPAIVPSVAQGGSGSN